MKKLMLAAACASLLAFSAQADEASTATGATTGAAAGAVTGAVVGGPVGAVVGGAVGAGVGASAGANADKEKTTCVVDAYGNQTCRTTN